MRPDSGSTNLLLLRDGRPVDVECVSDLFQRTRRRVGFRVHAHKFRHTFATEVRRSYGLEYAGAGLGHSRLSASEVYAERDEALAVRVAREVG